METDKSARGNAAQFFVAGELCRRGFAAVITTGNTPNTDILFSNLLGTNFAHIQVKTFVPGRTTCSVGHKAERNYGPRFFWVLAGIPLPSQNMASQYYVIPSKVLSEKVSFEHRRWLASPGKKGQEHRDNKMRTVHLPPRLSPSGWSIAEYLGRWDLIESVLQ
jgi:hypothetical protein